MKTIDRLNGIIELAMNMLIADMQFRGHDDTYTIDWDTYADEAESVYHQMDLWRNKKMSEPEYSQELKEVFFNKENK